MASVWRMGEATVKGDWEQVLCLDVFKKTKPKNPHKTLVCVSIWLMSAAALPPAQQGMGCVVCPEIETNTNPREGKEWGTNWKGGLKENLNTERSCPVQPQGTCSQLQPAELKSGTDIWVLSLGNMCHPHNPRGYNWLFSPSFKIVTDSPNYLSDRKRDK